MTSLPAQISLTISASRAGKRLDKILASEQSLCELSRSRLQALILQGDIRINGHVSKASHRVKEGELVTVNMPTMLQEIDLRPIPVEFGVIYEDHDIIVVDKPAGLVIHPAPGHEDFTLVHGLLHHCGDLSGIGGERRPGIVHRLDKDTSGVVIVAKHDQAHQHLAGQFQQRTVRKIYHAIVAGQPPQQEGIVHTLLGRHPIQRKKMAVLKHDGRPALTRYRCLDHANNLSLLQVIIETGRTHQIRVHMASLGCPVLADPIYGGKKSHIVSAARLCLHASQLQINHPSSQKEMVFRSPLPADIQVVLSEYGLSGNDL